MDDAAVDQEILELSRQLLNSIDQGDWQTYTSLCAPTLSCFEPEACGSLVEGMPFHETYFINRSEGGFRRSTISTPHVRRMGDSVVVAYTRLLQTVSPEGEHVSTSCNETRVWTRIEGQWQHVHFHRSAV